MIGGTGSDTQRSWRFWFLAAFIVFVFAIGGASRADSIYLLVLRPVAVLVCAAALVTLPTGSLRRYKALTWFACATVALPVIQLVPLPPGLSHLLPGHALVADIDRATGLDVWRPISMVPSGTRNALFSLSVPLAVFLIGIAISREEQQRMLPVVCGLGIISAFVGLLQAVGSTSSPFYFHELSNDGSAIGLFVNRNHHAYVLATLFPMIAVIAANYEQTSQAKPWVSWVALAFAILLIPFILITGSRSGLAVALVGALSGAAIYRLGARPVAARAKRRTGAKSYFPYFVAGTAACVLVGLSVVFSRALSIERLTTPGQLDDLRFSLWAPTLAAAWEYFPFGSGLGSFVEVYQIKEARNLLGSSYINHAHNDWLEVLMTAGLPGAVLLAVAVIAWGKQGARAWWKRTSVTRDDNFGRLGSVIFLLFALGSISDYPLRTPSVMAMAVLAALWMNPARPSGAKSSPAFEK